MELPLLLAGPILRRVDPGIVSVWTAFSSPAEVTLEVFEGRVWLSDQPQRRDGAVTGVGDQHKFAHEVSLGGLAC